MPPNVDAVQEQQSDDPKPAPGRKLAATWWPIPLWLAGLAFAVWWHDWLQERGYYLWLGTARPFLDNVLVQVSGGIWITIAVGVALIAALPYLAANLPWRWLVTSSWLLSSLWAVCITFARSSTEFVRPFTHYHDYINVVPAASADLLGFINTYTDKLLEYPTHVQGHPPGQVVYLTLLDWMGIQDHRFIGATYVLIGASAIAAVAITAKRLSGREDLVRRAMPLLVLAPAAVWIATSPDAVFAGLLAWGVALLALAADRWPLAIPAGVLLGLCPFFSYGLLPMGLMVVAVVIVLRPWRAVLIAVGSAAVVLIIWTALGFWILEGMAATRIAWQEDPASVRPYFYFLFANLVVFATILGPGIISGLPRAVRLPSQMQWLIWLSLAGAICGMLTGFMRGEVERIWLPVVYWVGLAGAVTGYRRGWLALSAILAVVLQVVIKSPW